MKLILFVVIGIASFVIVQVRKAGARRRLAELDDGRRCVACDSTTMEVIGGNARCLRCGHTASLAGLRSAQVSDNEINAMVEPDNRRRW